MVPMTRLKVDDGSTALHVVADIDALSCTSEYDLLSPTCVRWSNWRLSDCSEYNASESDSESEERDLESENGQESKVNGSDPLNFSR